MKSWKTTITSFVLIMGVFTTTHAQPVNDITAITPNSTTQGTAGQMISFTLSSGFPPAPPAGVIPSSVSIGDLQGQSMTHNSQYIVTAVFDFAADLSPGTKDAVITFLTPQGHTLTFSMTDGFTVEVAADSAPVITQQPQSITVAEGSPAIFNIKAIGTEPISYQWCKEKTPIAGATASVYTITAVTTDNVGAYDCLVTNDLGSTLSKEVTLSIRDAQFNYPICDTGQVTCYGERDVISEPAKGEAFYGQDAQHEGNPLNYTLSDDGLTVLDNVTGLTWTQSPDLNQDGSVDVQDKLTYAQAMVYPDQLNTQNFSGFNDWRLPTMKELYSLMNFKGTDPSGPQGMLNAIPFIDTDYFAFGYGDTSAGEREIDAQFATTTLYVSTTMGGNETMFGLNIADGRIKGYPIRNKSFYVYFVRGHVDYGINSFVDNTDGTVSDQATGLMWSQDDSGVSMNWEEALAWAQAKNANNYLGYNNWRVPDAKELQSIVDYTRSPDTTSSAAIDPVFNTTAIINEAGQADYPTYWTSTTHANSSNEPGRNAAYICFGRGLGYWNYNWTDVHGAGCQRSDPKAGDPADWPYGNGPQGDAIRIYNYVRLVRDVE